MGDQGSSPGGGPSTPGLTQVNDGINTGSNALSLIQGIDQLFGSPISRRVVSQRRKDDKKIFLGEWHDFLYDAKADVYHTPVLRKAPFWAHITRCAGVLRPRGRCDATAAWAKLLYGLAITPDDAGTVVSKALRTSHREANHGADVALELDGEVLCHVVNLYGHDEARTGRLTAARLHHQSTWTTALGRFWAREDADAGRVVEITYRPSDVRLLGQVKRPFPSFRDNRAAPLDPDSLLPMYELALDLGTSDATVAWPDKASSLACRAAAVVPTLEHLGFRPPPGTKYFLITPSWLKEPERIHRRITFNGGADDSFLADVLDRVEARRKPPPPPPSPPPPSQDPPSDRLPSVVLPWSEYAETQEQPDSTAQLRQQIHSRFLLQKRGSPPEIVVYPSGGFIYDFYPIPPMSSPMYSAKFWKVEAKVIMKEVLDGYGDQELGGWKRALHDGADAVCDFLLWDNSMVGRGVYVDSKRVILLDLDRDSPLWATPQLRVVGDGS